MGRAGRTGRADRNGERSSEDRKPCAGCGRTFDRRPSMAPNWDEVRWCSHACRRRGIRPVDRVLEVAIGELLADRPRDGTICPSEAARRVDPERWPALMEPARRAARRMVAAGTLEIVQDGRVVDPSHAKGPILLRRARSVG